jgi:hypothetical protein
MFGGESKLKSELREKSRTQSDHRHAVKSDRLEGEQFTRRVTNRKEKQGLLCQPSQNATLLKFLITSLLVCLPSLSLSTLKTSTTLTTGRHSIHSFQYQLDAPPSSFPSSSSHSLLVFHYVYSQEEHSRWVFTTS